MTSHPAEAATRENGDLVLDLALALAKSENDDHYWRDYINEAKAALTFLSTHQQQGEWQSIETAPKDGTRFLAIDQCQDQMILRWDRDANDFLDETLDCPEWTVTHWQPLPKPPEQK